MEHRIIPCAEGEDEFIADKLNAITNSKIDFEDTKGRHLSPHYTDRIRRQLSDTTYCFSTVRGCSLSRV